MPLKSWSVGMPSSSTNWRYCRKIDARSAVKRALKVLADKRKPGFEKDTEARRNLFGEAQYQRR